MRLFSHRSKELEEVQLHLRNLRNQVFTELDEHRDAINADTEELGSQSGRLEDVERKLDVLSARLDKLHFGSVPPQEQENSVPLTLDEQQVFLCLYTAEESGLALRDVCLRSGVSFHELSAIVDCLRYKNIPVVSEHAGDESVLRLDAAFKERQAKYSIVRVSDYARTLAQTRQHITLDRFESF